MKSTSVFVLLCVLLAIGRIAAHAVCMGTSVHAFGAKGDGQTDDTAAIRSAIDAVSAAGGGAVVFNVARYFTAGTLSVPTGVILCGVIEGPFDVEGVPNNPVDIAVAPTLLVTNTTAPFITLQGMGSGVTDLMFYYPNQAAPSTSAPNVYPYTVLATAPGTKVVRSTVINAYNFLDIESGRVIAQDLFISAFNIGVNVDHAHGHVTLRNLLTSVFWDLIQHPTFPTTIDTWVQAHRVALVVNRVDSIDIHDFAMYFGHAGIILADSPDPAENPRCGYGTGSDINLDSVEFGIVASASTAAGYEFSNAIIGSNANGQAVAQLKSGGSMAPNVLIEGGSIRGNWSLGEYPTAAGHLTVANIIGYDLP